MVKKYRCTGTGLSGIVEALQFTGSYYNVQEEFLPWMGEVLAGTKKEAPAKLFLRINNTSGPVNVYKDEWVLKSELGHFYRLTDGDFQKNYEEVVENPAKYALGDMVVFMYAWHMRYGKIFIIDKSRPVVWYVIESGPDRLDVCEDWVLCPIKDYPTLLGGAK